MESFDFKTLALVAGAFVAVFIYFETTPMVALRIIHTWLEPDQCHCLIRLEIENVSRVPLEMTMCQFQLLEHSIKQQPRMLEFVPLSKARFDETEDQFKPRAWKPPELILKTTKFLYPKEKIVVERLEKALWPDTYFHVALQFRGSVPFLSKVALYLRRVKGKSPWKEYNEESWTTTAILHPQLAAKASGVRRVASNQA